MEDDKKVMTKEEQIQQYKLLYDLINETICIKEAFGFSVQECTEALKSLRYDVVESQIEFYYNWLDDHKDKILQEVVDALWVYLFDIPVPEIPAETEEEKERNRKPIESYMCAVVVKKLLCDRLDFMKSCGNDFDMSAWIWAGYSAYYIETMKRVVEENLDATTEQQASLCYDILYKTPHTPGFLFSVDKIDILEMMQLNRERIGRAKEKREVCK